MIAYVFGGIAKKKRRIVNAIVYASKQFQFNYYENKNYKKVRTEKHRCVSFFFVHFYYCVCVGCLHGKGCHRQCHAMIPQKHPLNGNSIDKDLYSLPPNTRTQHTHTPTCFYRWPTSLSIDGGWRGRWSSTAITVEQ